MRYVAAYMLAVLGGNEQPSADDVRTIIESVGVEVDESSLKILMDKLEGKNIHDIQEEGLSRLQTVSFMSSLPEVKLLVPAPVEEVKDKEEDKITDNESDDDDDIGIMNIFG